MTGHSPVPSPAPVAAARRRRGAVALAAATAVTALIYPLLLLVLRVPAAMVVAVTGGVFVVMFTAVRAVLALTGTATRGHDQRPDTASDGGS